MELILVREYQPGGTNGVLCIKGETQPICYTIELPWLDNKRGLSCIPEGVYKIAERSSEKFGRHLLITGVPERDLILVHPANNALEELKGCIAPVTTLTGAGKGVMSVKAFRKLMLAVKGVFDQRQTVSITITCRHNCGE